MRDAWPADRPMSVRISANDWMGDLGVTPDEAVEIGRAFAEAGADLIDVSAGQTWADCQPIYGRMFQTPFADQIRNEGRLTTMAVGNIYETDHVNSILAAGRADLVALARPHLIDPMWTLRAAARPGLSPRPRAAAISRRHGPARPQPAARSGAQGMRLEGHHAFITGGGTGIGAAIARALAAEGAKLTLVGRRREKLEEVGAEPFDGSVAAGRRHRPRPGRRRFADRARGAGADHHPRQQCRRRARARPSPR